LFESLARYRARLDEPGPAVEIASERNGDTIGSFLLGKLGCLDDLIADIDADVVTRDVLFANVTCRIYQHYCYLKSKLYEMHDFPVSSNRALEMRRTGLEKQLDGLLQEHRAEQIERFKDVAKLKTERRDWKKQRADLAQRVRLVLGESAAMQ